MTLTTWQQVYATGRILRHRDTPATVIATLGRWFDGGDSAMCQFNDQKAVAPLRLLREIETCISINNQGEVEAQRLDEARQWALKQLALARAAKALANANILFTKVSRETVDREDAEDIRDLALSKERRPLR